MRWSYAEVALEWPCVALELHWLFAVIALALLCSCPGVALELPWSGPGVPLEVSWLVALIALALRCSCAGVALELCADFDLECLPDI